MPKRPAETPEKAENSFEKEVKGLRSTTRKKIVQTSSILAAALVTLAEPASGADKPFWQSQDLERFRHKGLHPTLVMPEQKLNEIEGAAPPEKRTEEIGEIGPEEIEIMKESINSLSENYLNPSLNLYLKNQNQTNLKTSLERVFKDPTKFRYQQEENKIIITKRSKEVSEIPDSFKIILEEGKVAGINEHVLELNAYDDWETVAKKSKQYREERFKYYEDGTLMPPGHKTYDDFIRFELDKLIVHLLKELRTPRNPEEKRQVESQAFRDIVARSSEHGKGHGRFSITVNKRKGKILIKLKSTKTEGLYTLLTILPDGTVEELKVYNPDEYTKVFEYPGEKEDGDDFSATESQKIPS